MTAPTRPIRDLDVPLSALQALIARQREQREQASADRSVDRLRALLACAHPDTCTCTPEETSR